MKTLAVAVLVSLLASMSVAVPEQSASAWASEGSAVQAVEAAVSPVQDSVASKPGIEGARPEAVGVIVQYENVPGVDVPESVAQVLDDVEQGIDEAASQLLEIPEVDSAVEIDDGLFAVGFEDVASEDTVGDLVDAIAESPGVASVEPDWRISVNFQDVVIDEPIDILEVDVDSVSANAVQSNVVWGLDRIDQKTLPLNFTYQYDDTGQGVRVYVVDTGVRSTHVDFQGRVTSGFSVISDGQGTNDCNGHGTHVAGTIAGALHGVAKQATIVPVRVLDCSGSGSVAQLLAALDWVKTNAVFSRPAKSVVNLSLGGPFSELLNAKVTELVSAGIPVVVASGNEATDACEVSPASAPAAITVNASTPEDGNAPFSNYGECSDLYAPGVAIKSTYHLSDTSTARASGTSMAAPHVAGAIARLLARGANGSDDFVAVFSAANSGVVNSGLPGDPSALAYVSPGSGTPGTPANVRLSEVQGGLQVSWNWPESSGDSADLTFTARAYESAEALTAVDSCETVGLSCVFSALTPGRPYFVEVRARNSQGTAPGSVPRTSWEYIGISPIEIGVYGKQETQIQVYVCVNDPIGNPSTVNYSSSSGHIRWRLETMAGALVASDATSATSNPMPRFPGLIRSGSCKGNYVHATGTNGLTPGTTYRYVVDYNIPLTSGRRSGEYVKYVTTMGGCALTAPPEDLPRTYLSALVDSTNRVVEVRTVPSGPGITDEDLAWWWAAFPQPPGYKLVPTYYGWPGKQYAGAGMYYDPETGNFGWPLANGQLSTSQSLIQQVGLEGCRGVADVILDVADESADTCTLTSRGVVGARDGGCVVEVTARSKSTRFGARSTITREAFAVVKTTPLGPPISVLARLSGESSAVLTWGAPRTVGAAPVEDYIVEHSSDNGTTWAEVEPDPISTAATQTVRDLEPGSSYLFRVSAKNAVSQSLPARSSAVTVLGSFVAEVPTISGSAVVGQTLSASPGEWTPAPTTVAYQWFLNGAVIRGATGSTYVVGSKDVGRQVSVRVTGSKTGYVSTVRESTRTSAVLAGFPFDVRPVPTITGSAVVGQTLTASLGVWTPAPTTVAYQWLVNGAVIRGATGSTYVVGSKDVGRQVSVRVTGSKASYLSTMRESTRTSTVLAGWPFDASPAPTITGAAVVGQTLSASLGEWTPTPTTVAYQWLLNGAVIGGATGSTYTVTSAAVGRQVSVRVTGSKVSYLSTVRESTRTSAVVGITPLLITNAASIRSSGSVGVFQEVTYSGGSGIGAVSLAVSGSGCTAVGTMVTARATATCTVTLVKAASGIFPSQTSQPTVFSFRSTTTSTFWSNYWWDEYDWTVADITQTERDLVSITAEINRLAANGQLRSSWGEKAIARRLALWAHLEEREEELEYISWRLWLHGYNM